MLRDLGVSRRNSNAGNATASEDKNDENLPVDPSDSSAQQLQSDPSRPPLQTIQELVKNPKLGSDQGMILRRKPDSTPFKNQSKVADPSRLPFQTSEKIVARYRFDSAMKTQPGVNAAQEGDDSNCHLPSNQLPPMSRGARLSLGGGHGMNTPRTYRTTGKASSVRSDCSSTQGTPAKSVMKAANSGFSSSRPPISVGTRTVGFAMASKGIPTTSTLPTVVNSAEAPHFELKEDPSFWMDNNVQVVIRVRPLNSTEKTQQGFCRCLKQQSAQNITWIGEAEIPFKFDYVACETINQEMLFRVAGLPMVENCMSGYNSCVFAYGQTGSGKTYTMLGETEELELRPRPTRGMTPRIFEFLFARIKAEEESRRDEKLKYRCRCSFLEIYNEQIIDLLDPSSSNLLLREDISKGVYVENLTEYVVENATDVLKLLLRGAANRKVASTTMNHESSRSHTVFTCIIESKWEKDLTVNIRMARLNLVDLAGSERQKSSAAEGDRLKEASSINKSLSTLGHVIMVLADVAHGKQRHVPYRDSKLTFLLQDSLGGNSKTMIIANVSPSICSANETRSTLRFAQRARLIQNNAVVNEDASEDIVALRHQIHLLKEELLVLKRENVSRSLSFRAAVYEDSKNEVCDASIMEKLPKVAEVNADELQTDEGLKNARASLKQLKSLEELLAGALRREKMADTTIKQLKAEIEQLNCLVHQRVEETQSTKMMLKLREDKIRHMDNLLEGRVSINTYLLEEKLAFSEEVQLLRERVERNPEVTRLELENNRLQDQLRRFQGFYEEGERELLLAEVSRLHNKLLEVFDGKCGLDQYLKSDMETLDDKKMLFALSSKDNDSSLIELNKTRQELERCRFDLQSCLQINESLTRKINNLPAEINSSVSANNSQHSSLDHWNPELLSESSYTDTPVYLNHPEEILNLQLELDILKAILAEEKAFRREMEERANHASEEDNCTNGRVSYKSDQYEGIKDELKNAKSVIEALESEHFLLITEMEEIREKCNQKSDLVKKKEHEISLLRNRLGICSCKVDKLALARQEEIRNIPSINHENENSPLQMKLRKMQTSLEMARDLNMRYLSDQVSHISVEQEMEEVRRQVEIETTEVIVCLQEELVALRKQVEDSKKDESITKQRLLQLETEVEEQQSRLCLVTQENETLEVLVKEKDSTIRSLTEDWERLAYEIADILADGHVSLEEASDQVVSISGTIQQRSWIGEQVERMIGGLSERDLHIEELHKCLEEAQNIRNDMEWKLRSLRGAALAISEAQQQESCDKESETVRLTSEITNMVSMINELEGQIKVKEEQIKKAELCATVAFKTVNKLSDMNATNLQEIEHVKFLLDESKHAEAKKEIQALSSQLKQSQLHFAELQKLSQVQEKARDSEQMKKEDDAV